MTSSVKDNLINSLKINQFIQLLLHYSHPPHLNQPVKEQCSLQNSVVTKHTTFFNIKSYAFSPQYIYAIKNLSLKSNYVPKEWQLVDICNAHVVFYLWGSNNIFKYCSDEFHVLRSQYLLLSRFGQSTQKLSHWMGLQVHLAADQT